MQYTDAIPTVAGGPRRVVGAMALVVGAILGIVGLSSGEGLAFTGPVETTNSSDSNKPSYWGAGCTKLDRAGGTSWTADKSYDIVVLKAGTTDYAFYDVVKGDVLTIPQAISHFIFCPATTTTTTTTTVPEETTTTTTVPETTTTTTVPEETTTTTTVVDQGGPTTTTTLPEETTTSTTTTTTLVGQQGPTTTVASAAATTTTVPRRLPTTGGEMRLAMLGGVLIAVGVTMLTLSRTRTV